MTVKKTAGLLGLGLALLLSCGGKVVLDTPGAGSGTGGAGGAGNTSTTSFASVVGSSSSGTSSCQTSSCSGDSAGDCSCNGTCTDGSSVVAECGTDPALSCTCLKNGTTLGSCMPSSDPPNCDVVEGCCSALF